MNDIKQGKNTSEFWGKNIVQVLTGLVGILALIGVVEVEDTEKITMIVLGVIAGLEALYGLYRTIVKSYAGRATFAQLLPEIEYFDTLEISEDES